MTSYKDMLYYPGAVKTILFASTNNGKMPAKIYFDSIGPPDWSKLDRILKRLADHGHVRNTEQFRSVGDNLYELKGGGFRLLGFFKGGQFVLTNGFEKRGGGKSANRVPPSERKKALRIRSEFEKQLSKK